METSLKKWMLRRCGWGPSDCQNCDVDGFRRASTPQSGLKVETVQDARAEISRRCERDGSGTAALRCGRGQSINQFRGLERGSRPPILSWGVMMWQLGEW